MKTMTTVLGSYYVVTGLWPLISIVNFQMFTGVKKDTCLVKMVGLLAFSIGCTLLFSAKISEAVPKEMVLLAVLSTASFSLIDIRYVAKGTIPKIYLGDAFVELIFFSYFLAEFI